MYSLDHSGQPRVWSVVREQCLVPIQHLIGRLTGETTPLDHQLPAKTAPLVRQLPAKSTSSEWVLPHNYLYCTQCNFLYFCPKLKKYIRKICISVSV